MHSMRISKHTRLCDSKVFSTGEFSTRPLTRCVVRLLFGYCPSSVLGLSVFLSVWESGLAVPIVYVCCTKACQINHNTLQRIVSHTQKRATQSQTTRGVII